jgi:hypothetical protein
MKHIVINYLALLLFISCDAQKIEKKTIYLNFTEYLNCKYDFELKKNVSNGIQFNLCSKAIFLYNTLSSDTLNLDKLKKYKISSFEEVEKQEKQWRVENKKALIKKFGKLYPPFNKNGIFKTYLIEILDDKRFVVYPVEWRNLDIEK